MKVAIIFLSKHGTTNKVAHDISSLMNTIDVSIIDIENEKNIDISEYDGIILGAPVYAGKISKVMHDFIGQNEKLLMTKPLGIFVCGMIADDIQKQQELENAYPKNIFDHAKAKEFLGGELLFEKMNFIERFIIKRIMKSNKSISQINKTGEERFVEIFSQP